MRAWLFPTALLLKVETKVEEYLKDYQAKRRSVVALLPENERMAIEGGVSSSAERVCTLMREREISLWRALEKAAIRDGS